MPPKSLLIPFAFPLAVAALLASAATAAAQEATADPIAAAEASAADARADAAAVEPEAAEPAAVEPVGVEPEAAEGATAPDPAPAAEPTPDGETDEPAAVAVGSEEGVDWAGLAERFPEFFAVTHHAAVHLPIALWLFGALFVVIGLVVPSLRNQIPVACLIGGALTSVAAAASGWWYADYNWGEPWAWGDGFGDFDEHLVKHRWVGVALVVVSLGLSVVAIISQVRRSRRLGFLWRVGLIGLALAVAWEGHLGGELIQGEGFLEEALQAWIDPDAAE